VGDAIRSGLIGVGSMLCGLAGRGTRRGWDGRSSDLVLLVILVGLVVVREAMKEHEHPEGYDPEDHP